MSLSGTPLHELNGNVDFKNITVRYQHKLLRGNFAIVPTLKGTHVFALLGNAYAIRKIMTCNALFGLHYVDPEDRALKFDSALFAERDEAWFREQAKRNGFREIKRFIRW